MQCPIEARKSTHIFLGFFIICRLQFSLNPVLIQASTLLRGNLGIFNMSLMVPIEVPNTFQGPKTTTQITICRLQCTLIL